MAIFEIWQEASVTNPDLNPFSSALGNTTLQAGIFYDQHEANYWHWVFKNRSVILLKSLYMWWSDTDKLISPNTVVFCVIDKALKFGKFEGAF